VDKYQPKSIFGYYRCSIKHLFRFFNAPWSDLTEIISRISESQQTRTNCIIQKEQSEPSSLDWHRRFLSNSPNHDDFLGEIQPSEINSLNGLTHKCPVSGKGTVQWSLKDLHGLVRIVKISEYYVPNAYNRLFCPQRYFQESHAGSLTVDCKLACLTLSDGSIMKFPFIEGSHLPLMIPSYSYSVGVSYEDCLTLIDPKMGSSYLNVADETNQNLTGYQKELLLCLWCLVHENMSWIQRLLATRNETNL